MKKILIIILLCISFSYLAYAGLEEDIEIIQNEYNQNIINNANQIEIKYQDLYLQYSSSIQTIYDEMYHSLETSINTNWDQQFLQSKTNIDTNWDQQYTDIYNSIVSNFTVTEEELNIELQNLANYIESQRVQDIQNLSNYIESERLQDLQNMGNYIEGQKNEELETLTNYLNNEKQREIDEGISYFSTDRDTKIQAVYDYYNNLSTGSVLSVPTNLKQEIQSQYLEKQEVSPGEKVGKYQSGSGMILSAYVEVSTGSQARLEVEVYKLGETTPTYITGSDYKTSSQTGYITLPYLGTGSFFWKARVVYNTGNASEWINFGTDNAGEVDYAMYEGFEPYPFGYKFYNRVVQSGLLTGKAFFNWKGYLDISGFNEVNNIVDGNKWNIFRKAFDISSLENSDKKMIDAFENVGLNKPDVFEHGSCYGMAVSSAMQYANPGFLQNNYYNFSSRIGNGFIWDKIESPSTINTGLWDIYNSTLETILAFQLSQEGDSIIEAKNNGITNPLEVINEIKNNPNNTYVLNIWGVKQEDTLTGTTKNPTGHAVIPYKVEVDGDITKIYVWDNNIPFPYYNNRTNILSYDQFITVYSNGKWKAELYEYNVNKKSGRISFDKMSLLNINNISIKSVPKGFNTNDTNYILSGSSDLYVVDSLGNISGFSGGTILEEIPGVNVIVPLNATLDGITQENTWKQIYLPQKQDLTVKVVSKGQENYDLMIAGGDYYTKLENIETSTGQIDIYNSTVNNLQIDFDDNKTGSYNLLTDNFQENNTGTIYIDQLPIIPNKQEYNIDWNKVQTNEIDSISQNIDINNDGIYDTTTNLPPVFQDLLSPTTNYTFSGTQTPNTTINSYIETISITLQSTDNEGGSGIDTIYYSLDNTTTTEKVYLPYSESIIINGVNNYTLSYYAIDKFGNKEILKTLNFTLTENPETYQGEISGYIYEDINSNGIKETTEKTMAGWKVCIDQNNNNDCEENIEPFNITNNQGYYEFNGLATNTYKILLIPHQNWITTNPSTKYYNIQLSNGQKVTNNNFGNLKTKGK